jgi:hypothetical protein
MIESSRQELVKAIHSALDDISTGNLSVSEAEKNLQVLEKRFSDLSKEITSGDGQNTLEGLCCNHNSGNCAIYTGILEVSSSRQSVLSSFGPQALSEKIIRLCAKKMQSFEDKMYVTVKPDDEPDLKNDLHIYPFRKTGHNFYVVASLSSSSLFNQDAFIHFGNFIDMLFPTGKDHPCGVMDTFHSMRRYIDQNMEHYSLHAQVYHFPDLDRIFSHAGIHTLFDVSDQIEKQMTEMWGGSIPRFTISLKEYALIIPREKGQPISHLTGDFSYKGIPLPFLSKNVDLDQEGAFYNLVDALFSLSQNE